jgi:hypothetical protein
MFAEEAFFTIMARICSNPQMFGLDVIEQEFVAVPLQLGRIGHLTDGTSSSASMVVNKNPLGQSLSPHSIRWFKVVGKFCKINQCFGVFFTSSNLCRQE